VLLSISPGLIAWLNAKGIRVKPRAMILTIVLAIGAVAAFALLRG